MAGGLCALITALAAVSYGALVKFFGDELQQIAAGDGQGGAGANVFWWLAGLIVIAAICRAVSLYGMTIFNNTGVQNSLVSVSNAQFAALTDGDYGRLDTDASGGFVSRFIHDFNTLRDFGLRLANNGVKSLVTVVGALIMMVWMDWQLAVVLLLAYPLAIGPVIALGNRVRKRAKQSQEHVGEMTSLLTEGVQSARTVRAYGLEAHQKERASVEFRQRARLYLKVLADKAGIDPILEIAGGFAIAGILAFSAWRILEGGSSLGDFLGFITLIGVAAPEIRALGSLNALSKEAEAATERFHTLLDQPTKLVSGDVKLPRESVKGEVRFENVSFAYAGDAHVLQDVSFVVAPGQTVALVGQSGAGKSTIINLLLRLYDVAGGRIFVDGLDVKDVVLEDLRGAMALVEQDPTLFDDTVLANIQLGRFDASPEEIKRAAEMAAADGFIQALPEAYNSDVGERGGRLSGGQKQRLAIARAFLRDAPILLLDEATSALDASTEADVQKTLDSLAAKRTVILIAHKISTAKRADHILVFRSGKLVEQGTHETLIAKDGEYARLATQGS